MRLAFLERMTPRGRWWAGLVALWVLGWTSMYGQLWSFERMDAHRFTARAMLSGTLRLRGAVALAGHDEQVYGGAVYTNWGFGVPLLQVPFHALARLVAPLYGFFPDRAIYFVYFCAILPGVWLGFDRWLAARVMPDEPQGKRRLLSWMLTWFVFTLTLVPLMATRFVIFEETEAYALLLQLAILATYLRSRGAWTTSRALLVGALAGLALVVRATGLLYLGVWGGLVWLDGRTKRATQVALAAAPFVAFWLYANQVHAGSPFALGFGNSNPAWEYETPLLRFGSTCADTPLHTLQAAARLFSAFFLYVSHAPLPHMRACHFDLEERDQTGEPIFGTWVLVLLAGLLWGMRRARGRRLVEVLVPLGAFALLFAAFVRRGDGFCWRYVSDFWPLLVLATALHVESLPVAGREPARRMTKIFWWAGFAAFARFLVPWGWFDRPEFDPHEPSAMNQRFLVSRWGKDDPLPSQRKCTDPPAFPAAPFHHDRLGWKDGCTVGTFTNLYLGVPRRSSSHYTISLWTEGLRADRPRIYVNGRIYDLTRKGDALRADVDIDSSALHSPIVLVTVQWTRDTTPPPGLFLSIDLS